MGKEADIFIIANLVGNSHFRGKKLFLYNVHRHSSLGFTTKNITN